MLAKIYNTLAILAIATVLALGGFIGLLYGTGRLTPERIETVVAVLRGELDDREAERFSEQPVQEEDAGPPAAGHAPAQTQPARSADRLWQASLERAARDVAARQELLDHALQHLLVQQEKLAQEQAAWGQQKRRDVEAIRDEGFKDEVRIVAKLSPKLAKEHVVRAWRKHKTDAVRLLRALDVGKSQRILEQFKTPEEIEIMHQLLEQLRLHGADQLAAGSGTSSGDARP